VSVDWAVVLSLYVVTHVSYVVAVAVVPLIVIGPHERFVIWMLVTPWATRF
jgi:hypothetical protein